MFVALGSSSHLETGRACASKSLRCLSLIYTVYIYIHSIYIYIQYIYSIYIYVQYIYIYMYSIYTVYIYIQYIYIYFTESSVVSAHVLGSLLLPLFSMNLPIQKKNMAALVTSTLHLPQANPKNKIPYTKLNSITENRKKQKKTKQKNKKPKIPEKGWGAHSCWIFGFFVFLFFWFLCFFGGFAYCTACL